MRKFIFLLLPMLLMANANLIEEIQKLLPDSNCYMAVMFFVPCTPPIDTTPPDTVPSDTIPTDTIPELPDEGTELKAFPGAEGFGSETVGGRGGSVIYVTNLNNSGEGSLRAAIEADGPRTVVFQVSGNIKLNDKLRIRNPYLTIAGQTAPGDGICIQDDQITIFPTAHDVIIRHIRFRLGDLKQEALDGVSTRAENVIFDHCSMSWGIDEVFSPTGESNNVTVQWCIISEALHNSCHPKGPHGFGSLVQPSVDSKITYHHNLIANHYRRFPAVGVYNDKEVLLDHVNNVCYNWGGDCMYSWHAGEKVRLNIIGNVFKAGPDTEGQVLDYAYDPIDDSKWVWQENNLMNGIDIGWDMIEPTYTQMSFAFVIDEFAEVETDNPNIAYSRVLEQVGAILPKRDAIDERVIDGVIINNGKIIDSQEDVGGWTYLLSESPPIDSDLDGMPDEFEDTYGLDKYNPDDRNETNLSKVGYTNLEIYLASIGR